MDKIIKSLKGSDSRDLFKYLHKNLLSEKFYALDSDLELIEKEPVPFIVARLDFKLQGDLVSFTEAIAYNWLVEVPQPYRIPVYLIVAERLFQYRKPEDHRFTIYEFKHADWRRDPPFVEKNLLLENITWQELGLWEAQLRKLRKEEISSFLKKVKKRF
jgi:hypothetical protein